MEMREIREMIMTTAALIVRFRYLKWNVDYEHEELCHGEGGEEHASVDVVSLPGLHIGTN